tara:strand:- start:23463 stop:24512 length:1050 start_codon:yes stop_codon:yes gene_type:complete
MKNSKYFITLLLSVILICVLSKYSKNGIVEKYYEISSEDTNIVIGETIEILSEIINTHIVKCQEKYNTKIKEVLESHFSTENEKIVAKYKSIDNNVRNISLILFGNDLEDVEDNLCDKYLKPKKQKEERITLLDNYKTQITAIINEIKVFKTDWEAKYDKVIGDENTDNTILGDAEKYIKIKEELNVKLSTNSTLLQEIINNLEGSNTNPINDYDKIISDSDNLGSSLNTKEKDITTSNDNTLILINNRHNFDENQYNSDNDVNGVVRNLCFGSSNDTPDTPECIQSDWGCELSCSVTDTEGKCFTGSNIDNIYTDIFGNQVKLHSHIHDYTHHNPTQHSTSKPTQPSQ